MADSTPTTAAGWTRNAIHEIQSGEVADARQMLAAALRLDPNYESAWIWFGSIATDDAQQRYCYERALAIDPDSVVADQLARIKTTESRVPPELQDMEAPPLPEAFGGERQQDRAERRSWWLLVLMAAVLLGGLVAGVWYLWPRGNLTGEPVYVAFVGGISGSGADAAAQMERGLQVYFDFVNSNGGIDGRPVKIVAYDDEDNVDKAVEVANQIVADNQVVAVVGHRLSSTSMAAAPIYQAAGIPMISSTATADAFTVDCDWCYRSVFDNSSQGEMIAAYTAGILDIDDVVIISEQSSYGESLANGFTSTFEEAGSSIAGQYELPADPTSAGASIDKVAADIAADHKKTMVFLAMGADLGQPVLLALRSAETEGLVFGGDAFSSENFLEEANRASEHDGGGTVTSGLYVSAPIFVDSLTGESVRLAEKYEDKFGDEPTWRTFTTADAGVAVVSGLRLQPDAAAELPLDQARAGIREQWDALDSAANSIPGFIGPLYFDAHRGPSRPVAIGIAQGNVFDSAPRQLLPISDEIKASNPDVDTVKVGNDEFAVKRVVLTGVDFNLIRDLDTVGQTFFADFFVWLKYYGDDDAANIVFTNISDPELLIVTEVRSSEIDDMKYKVFRVTGAFTSPLDFRSFPFDTQNLQVTFQNQTATEQELVYAMDSEFQEIPPAKRLQTGNIATSSINRINSWQANNLRAFAGSVGTVSNLGDPALSSSSQGIEFSQVGVSIIISRDVGQFLLKNLLPLVLLLAITYISLFFSHEQTTERVSFGITGVLTGAVLLSTVVSVLPDVGYTVAIEWAFYGFILLSALCILVALIGGRLNEARQLTEMRALDLASRIGYPILVVAGVLAYWMIYG